MLQRLQHLEAENARLSKELACSGLQVNAVEAKQNEDLVKKMEVSTEFGMKQLEPVHQIMDKDAELGSVSHDKELEMLACVGYSRFGGDGYDPHCVG